jgi:uncharacterized protein YaaW (UPF0174 family)
VQETYDQIAKKISEEFDLFSGKRSLEEDQAIFDAIIEKINEVLIEKAIDMMSEEKAQAFSRFLDSPETLKLDENGQVKKITEHLLKDLSNEDKQQLIGASFATIDKIRASLQGAR